MSLPGAVSDLRGRRGYSRVSGDPGVVGELVVEQRHVGQDGEPVWRAPGTRVPSVVARHVAHVQQRGDAQPQVRCLECELAVSETKIFYSFKDIEDTLRWRLWLILAINKVRFADIW